MSKDDFMLSDLGIYRSQIDAAGYRGMVVISGERGWCYKLVEQAVQVDENSLWIGVNNNKGIDTISARACLQHLGREHTDIIFDTWQGLDPDALAAISGTLKSGCILFILTPALDEWESFDDPEYKRIVVEPYQSRDAGRRFIRHMIDVITTQEDILIWKQSEEYRLRDSVQAVKVDHRYVDSPYKTYDQRKAVEAIVKVIEGHRRRPLLLIADRGRGKSSALGIAAAINMQKGGVKIGVTAPGRGQVDEIYKRIKEVCPAAVQHGMKMSVGNAELEFYAPDEILNSLPKLNLLLVDEAAAIPIAMLETMLENYSRIVYATTVHGYEGTGKGFELKFKQVVKNHCDKWYEANLKEPIRWSAGDFLERLINRMLLLDAENNNNDMQFKDEDVQVQSISADSLVRSKVELNDWFGLLVSAHYKTRPYDLRQMLDGPNIKIWNVNVRGKLIATAVVAMEGVELDKDTLSDIYQGRRRLHGHLMPQTLAAHAGHKDALNYKYVRIVRVAVLDEYRRRGIGRRLISEIESWAIEHGKDYLAVSFGASSKLINFWNDSGFDLVRLGFKKDASNGQHNLMMLRALHEKADKYLTEVLHKFIRDLPYLLAEPLKCLDARYVIAVNNRENENCITDEDVAVVESFYSSNRMYESSIRELSLSLSEIVFKRHDNEEANEALTLLIEKVWQKHEDQYFTKKYSFKGKAQLQLELKKAAKMMMAKLI